MSVETLGQAYGAGWTLVARCAWGTREGLKSVRECTYRRELDLETLLWTRGRDMPISWLKERLRCPACGSRRVSVIFSPPRNPKPVALPWPPEPGAPPRSAAYGKRSAGS